MLHRQRRIVCFAVAGLLAAVSATDSRLLPAQEEVPPKAKAKVVPPPPVEPAPFPIPATIPAPPYGMPNIPSLNYNYYYPAPAPDTVVSDIPARLYLCPRPAPPYVGYVYITYPPFQPHEWLWQHAKAYYRLHPGGGMTMTSMWWVYEDR
jgi:hypothetical protein